MKPIRLFLLALALVAMLAACGTATGGQGANPDPATADVTVIAADMAFDPGMLAAPAGRALRMALVNEDSMPHNVAIYTDEARSEKLFEGEMVTDGTIVYEIPALEAGEYFFDCSLHPSMTGTLVVGG